MKTIKHLISALLICTTFCFDLRASEQKNLVEFDSYNYQPGDSTCTENSCRIYIHVDKTEQKLYLYENGILIDTFLTSTGAGSHPTPDFNMRPHGPTYQKYTSKKYPGGDWKGLGNMPYVVFIKGGYAIHGTTPGNIRRLGQKASHGCVRLHPDDAKKIYDLVNQYGLENTWVTVQG